ncbi:MAG: hypothetical protein PHO32_09525 [Candidatus Cloacimonetes bacterium]|nr:hypothetical protein [Candidatus Cloacimonadota bacterium]
MSWKSLLLILLIIGVGGWFVLFGPGSCELFSDAKTKGATVDILPWMQKNISSDWLDEQPQAEELTVIKVKIKKITPTDERFVEDADVLILGNYTLKGESKTISFKQRAIVRIDRRNDPYQFTLVD